MLITNADLGGVRVDVRFDRKILEVKADIQPLDAEQVIDARGGALLPGLHDHHMHFLATAVWASSVDCGAVNLTAKADLALLLRQQPGSDWLRGVNYHESTAGELQRQTLDKLVNDRPVRIQHRSGKVWMLNSVAVELLALQQYVDLEGVEVDAGGIVTGRLFRLDSWLRDQLAADVTADVSALSQKLSSFGITGFTDTSATNSQQTQRLFADWQASGVLQQRILLMGDDSLTSGPLKVILDEDALPTLQSLITRLQQARARGRSFAFHCVTHLELLFALTALAEVEPDPRDRIEHAAIVYDTMLPLLKEHGVSVVTQPGFLWQRGDQYLTDLTALEVASLYRHKALLDFGINTIVSSDAPYGPLDPWQVMRAANQRCTRAGVVIGAAERVAPEQSLRGYLLHGQALQAPVRKVEPGADADLCLLNKPWSAIKKQLAEAQVQATICAGKVVYRR